MKNGRGSIHYRIWTPKKNNLWNLKQEVRKFSPGNVITAPSGAVCGPPPQNWIRCPRCSPFRMHISAQGMVAIITHISSIVGVCRWLQGGLRKIKNYYMNTDDIKRYLSFEDLLTCTHSKCNKKVGRHYSSLHSFYWIIKWSAIK